MGNKKQRGFTVIEVMLFLAVTAVLAVGILATAGVAIGQQRYRDSVTTLKSFIQDQYSSATNISNSRGNGWTCDTDGKVVEKIAGGGLTRGTSDCVIMGRAIVISSSGEILTASNVVGYRTSATAPAEASDIEELKKNYKMSLSPIDQESRNVEWGSQVVKPGSTTPFQLTLLVIRSPLSGSTLTFSAEGPTPSNLTTMVSADNAGVTRNLCVNPTGGFFSGKRAEVRIIANAASQSAVQVPPESEATCD